MTRRDFCTALLGGASLALTGAGCGSGGYNKAAPGQEMDMADAATKKVEAFKRLADAVAKDPNGTEVAVAVEDLTNIPLDPKAHPKQAEEIVQIYRQRVEGKVGRQYTQQVQALIAPLLKGAR